MKVASRQRRAQLQVAACRLTGGAAGYILRCGGEFLYGTTHAMFESTFSDVNALPVNRRRW